MKTLKLSFMVLYALLLSIPTAFGQDAPQRPEYVTVTTMHWNMDNKDFKMDEWKAIEKEYADKVTKKNEHVLSAAYYMHHMTADNTELLYVQTYPSWEAMGKAADRNAELAKAAWPDEKAREAFFKKRDKNYSINHSDEIYATLPHAKPLNAWPTEDMLLYVRKSHFAYPENGTQEEYETLNKEYLENVTHKNEYVKGYYAMAHAWGSDRTEMVEAFFVDSLGDIEKMFDKNNELFEAHWKDEAKRKEMNEKGSKYFDGRHGDYVYTYIAGIGK